MSRNHEHTTGPAPASRQAVSEVPAPADSVRRASANERLGNAALFACGACVLGVLALLVGQFGWWSIVLGPAYLCALAVTMVMARGRTNMLLAVALATASLGVLAALIRLSGLA